MMTLEWFINNKSYLFYLKDERVYFSLNHLSNGSPRSSEILFQLFHAVNDLTDTGMFKLDEKFDGVLLPREKGTILYHYLKQLN